MVSGKIAILMEWMSDHPERRVFKARVIRSEVFSYEVSRSTVNRVLGSLAKKGVLVKSLDGKNTVWRRRVHGT